MPTDLTNTNDVKRWLQPKIEIIVEEILKGIKEWNEKEIDRVVYSKNSPSIYQRTYEFRDDAWDGDITKSTIDEVDGTFEYLPNRITTVEQGVHASIISDYGELDDIRPYLAEIIYEGLAGHIFGTGFWTEKRDAWSELLRIARVDGPKMKTWIKNGARRAGLKIEF